MEMFSILIGGHGYRVYTPAKIHLTAHLKWVHFILCKVYLHDLNLK